MIISVITVCFNANRHIETCLRSVASQSFAHVEHIVIDGGSLDGTVETVGRHPHVSAFVSEPDGGIYDAMNKGIARATGDVLIFLNADDRFASGDALSAAADAMEALPDGDVYYGSLEVRHLDGSVSVYTPDPPSKAAELMVCGCLPHQSTLARRSVFGRTNGFDTRHRYHADYDWFLKIIHDDAIRLCRIDATIGSFALGGVSSQLATTQPEVYAIQNASPLYASAEWNKRRIEIYQKAFLAERVEAARLRDQVQTIGPSPVTDPQIDRPSFGSKGLARTDKSGPSKHPMRSIWSRFRDRSFWPSVEQFDYRMRVVDERHQAFLERIHGLEATIEAMRHQIGEVSELTRQQSLQRPAK